MFFILFLIDDIRIRIREAQKHMDPTDPDPQHWFLVLGGITELRAIRRVQRNIQPT
jgi:hypothetical protein